MALIFCLRFASSFSFFGTSKTNLLWNNTKIEAKFEGLAEKKTSSLAMITEQKIKENAIATKDVVPSVEPKSMASN